MYTYFSNNDFLSGQKNQLKNFIKIINYFLLSSLHSFWKSKKIRKNHLIYILIKFVKLIFQVSTMRKYKHIKYFTGVYKLI